MEPAQSEIKFKIIIQTSVIAINEKLKDKYIGGIGSDAKFERVHVGWYMHLDGSYESLFVGHERPTNIKEGDIVNITIEKA